MNLLTLLHRIRDSGGRACHGENTGDDVGPVYVGTVYWPLSRNALGWGLASYQELCLLDLFRVQLRQREVVSERNLPPYRFAVSFEKTHLQLRMVPDRGKSTAFIKRGSDVISEPQQHTLAGNWLFCSFHRSNAIAYLANASFEGCQLDP